jgi:hypothetical protein
LSGPAISYIMFVVEGRRRSVLFADCMDASEVTQRFDIRRPHPGVESICRRAPTAKRVIDNGIRSG